MSNSVTPHKALIGQTYNTSDGSIPVSVAYPAGTTYTTWNVPENYNAATIDQALGGAAGVDVTGVSGIVALTAAVYQPMAIRFSGTLTANVTYTFPAGTGGTWTVRNDTTGNFTITLQSLTTGASTTFTIPQDGQTYTVVLLAFSGGGFYISTPADGSITSAKLASNAVTTAKMADYTITNTKLLPSTVTGLQANTSLAAADQISFYDSSSVVTPASITVTGSSAPYTATVITSTAHGLTTGTSITVSNATGNTSVNGVFSIVSTGSTTFTYSVTASGSVTGTPVYIANPGLKKISFSDLQTQLTPIGTVNAFAGSTAPTGWLFCDGSSISRTAYAALFAVIGTTYGTVDANTFNLPDMRGRAVAGRDNMGGTSANRLTGVLTGGVNGSTLGATGGNEGNTLTEAQLPAHTHVVTAVAQNHGLNGAGPYTDLRGGNGDTNNNTDMTAISSPTGSTTAHNNVQPTLVLNYIIKA